MEITLYKDNLYIGLKLPNDNTGCFAEERTMGEGFRKQIDRHITILYYPIDILFKNIFDKDRENFLGKIRELLNNYKWKFKPTNIYKIERKGYFGKLSEIEHRESYISLVDIPDMRLFYDKLNLLLKLNLPTQFPHITLFTKGERDNPSYYGIPISSIEEFNNFNPREIK